MYMYIKMKLLKVIKNIPKFLSLYLIPGFILLYIYIPVFRNSLFIHGFDICIVGIIDVFFQPIPLWIKPIGHFLHTILLIPILIYPATYTPFSSIVLLGLAILVILYLPWWPYQTKRKTMAFTYLLLYFIMMLFVQNKETFINLAATHL